MPDILKQLGPKQYQFLKSTLSNLDSKAAANDDDDDVPNLVGTFEDAGKKWANQSDASGCSCVSLSLISAYTGCYVRYTCYLCVVYIFFVFIFLWEEYCN